MPALPGWVWVVAITLVCGAALWKGGYSERIAAVALFGAWVATFLVRNPDRYATQWGTFLVDVVLFVVLAALALRSDKYWPMFLAGFHLLAVVTHAGRILDKSLGAWAYLTAAQIWAYMTLYTLAFGTWGVWRERRQLAKAAAPTGPGATLR